MVTIDVSELETGMVLAGDVKAPNGRFLLGQGVEINAGHVEVMQTWGVLEVQIEGSSEEEMLAKRTSHVPPEKLKLAEELGADFGFNPAREDIGREVRALTEGRGADVSFEVVGNSAALKTAVDSVRKGATVTLVGNLSPVAEMPLQGIVTRQIRLQGSCAICGEYPAVLDMIARAEVDVEAILSAEAPLSEGADWFRRLYEQEPGLIKVVLKP